MKQDTHINLSEILGNRIRELAGIKNQKEIAEEAGFPKANILSIIKAGESKLSLDRVSKMAKALNMDVKDLMIPALRQYFSDDTIAAIADCFGSAETNSERDLLSIARKSTDMTQGLSFETREAVKLALSNNKPSGR